MADDNIDHSADNPKHDLRITNNHFYGPVQGAAIGSNNTINNHGNADRAWKDVYDWLMQGRTDLNFIAEQNDNERDCQYDLGQWFLNAKNFRDWRLGDVNALFCYGKRKSSSLMHLRRLTSSCKVVSARLCSCKSSPLNMPDIDHLQFIAKHHRDPEFDQVQRHERQQNDCAHLLSLFATCTFLRILSGSTPRPSITATTTSVGRN